MTAELEDARLRFERDWQRLRESLRREVGREPSWSRWAVPILGVASGLALAFLFGERKKLSDDSQRELPGS